MAVIQISRIQVRRGVADSPTPSGLPQLASGEIGWAIDQQRLWIGSGSIDEGAPAVENVEILTTVGFKQIINSFTASSYTYMAENINNNEYYQPAGAVGRTIQQKLDDAPVSITDFGVTFNQGVAVATTGTLDTTIATAISSLYYEGGATTTHAPTLNFPAGTYNLASTIYVPPYAKLVGAGKGKTAFVMTSTNTTILQTVGINTITQAVLTSTDIVSGPTAPQDILITGFTFLHAGVTANQTAQMILLDGVSNSTVNDCEFVGTYNTTSAIISTNSAIEIRNNFSENITIKDCEFENLAFSIVSNYDVNNITISNSIFDTNYESIQLGSNLQAGATTGPVTVSIANNNFDVVMNSAIVVGSNNAVESNVISRENTFINVGNNGVGDEHSKFPIIQFTSLGNQSINDLFQRFDNVQVGGTAYNTVQYPLVKGHAKIATRTPVSVSITTSSALQTLLVLPYDTSSFTTIVSDYVFSSNTLVRTGRLYTNCFNGNVNTRDEYNYQGPTDGQVTFSGTYTTGTIVLQALNSVSGTTGSVVISSTILY